MNPVIVFAWAVATLCKCAVLHLLWRQSLIRAYPLLACGLAGTLAKTVFLYGYYLQHGKAGYIAMWRQLQSVENVFYVLLTVEAVLAIGAHFPRGKWFAGSTLAIFGAMSGGAILATHSLLPQEIKAVYAPAALMSRHFAEGCMLTLAANIAFHSIARIQWRANVGRYVGGVGLLLMLGIAGLAMSLVSKSDYVVGMIGHLLMQGATIMACLAWMGMSGNGEQWIAPEPDPALLEALERQERKI